MTHDAPQCPTAPEPRCDNLERAIRLVEKLLDTAAPGPPMCSNAGMGDRVIVEVIRGGEQSELTKRSASGQGA